MLDSLYSFFNEGDEKTQTDKERWRQVIDSLLDAERSKHNISPVVTENMSPEQLQDIGVISSSELVVHKRETLMAFGNIPENDSAVISLALHMVPEIVLRRLYADPLRNENLEIDTVIADGPLSLKDGTQLTSITDVYKERPPIIRISLENIRKSFSPNEEWFPEEAIIFWFAAHEISDYVQIVLGVHDNINPNDKRQNEEIGAVKHKQSKSEQISNEIASRLTEKIFGVVYNANEDGKKLYLS